MKEIDLEKPVEISKDIYWIGSSEEALLRRNIYLRVFQGNDRRYSMIIDPGPPVDFEAVRGKIIDIVGALNKLDFIFINHQDPDVVINATRIQKVNPRVLTLMVEDTWRLVQFYGLRQNNFIAVEKFFQMKAKLRTGHLLQFVPTPFCHFRGACMYYDVNSRILFSGDFFGGISTSDLYATEAHWEGVKAFHQLYMPSMKAIRYSIQKIRELTPKPIMIAPQHGSILTGDVMGLFLERMEKLPVGIDLIAGAEKEIDQALNVVNYIASTAEKVLGSAYVDEIFELFHPDGSYPALFTVNKKNKLICDIKGNSIDAIEAFIHIVFSMCDEEQKSKVKFSLQNDLTDKDFALIPSLAEDLF